MALESLPMPTFSEPVQHGQVLAQALDAAHAIIDADRRASAVEQVGRLAAIQGVKSVFSEVLLDIPDPAGRANIHFHWARQRLESGAVEESRRHLESARAGLVDEGVRWRPRCEWLSKELAAADLAAVYAQLGDFDGVHGLIEFSAVGGLARASLRRSALWALFVAGARGLEIALEQAVKDALALPAEDDRRRAVVELGRLMGDIGMAERVPELLIRVVQERVWDSLQQRLMTIELGEILAVRGRVGKAVEMWHGLTRVLQRDWGDEPDPESLQMGVDLLCRLALMAHRDDVEAAREFFEVAVIQTGHTPLPPDPNARYPWRTLFRSAQQEPGISDALRNLLRQRNVVPPGWCYALGIMELESGRADRAERAASALEKGHAFNPGDVEPLWLAALLWARTGQVERALDAMYPVLDEMGEETSVDLPGQAGGASHVELLFVEALVAGGAIERAAELGRTVIEPALRARLLTVAGWAWLADKQTSEARILAVEAFHALEENLHSDRELKGGELGPALELVELLWRAGDEVDAEALFHDVMERMGSGPGVLVIPVLCRAAARMQDLATLERQLLEACVERCMMASEPETRCELLLLLAQQIS